MYIRTKRGFSFFSAWTFSVVCSFFYNFYQTKNKKPEDYAVILASHFLLFVFPQAYKRLGHIRFRDTADYFQPSIFIFLHHRHPVNLMGNHPFGHFP